MATKNKTAYALLNEAPEVVGIIASVLENSGSVDNAIRELASSGPSESRKLFISICSDADLRIESDMENAAYRMLSGLPESCSGYTMAVRMAFSASRTADPDERSRILKESTDISLNSLKDAGKSFSASLNTPCMAIFGLGIMIPMILMSIIPMMGVSSLFSAGTVSTESLAFLTLVLIPAIVLVIISGIESRNPVKLPRDTADLVPLFALASFFPFAFLLNGYTEDPAVSVCIGAAASCILSAIVARRGSTESRKKQAVGRSLEKSVFEIGNRLLGGTEFESSVEFTLASRPDCSFLAQRFVSSLTAFRGDVGKSITETFGGYSELFSDILNEIYVLSKKDPHDAGRMAMSLGRRNEDRESLRRNIHHDLKNMTDTMFGTAAVFAPLVLGLSVSMMEPMKEIAENLDTGGTSLILSAYLCELCALVALLLSMIDGRFSVNGFLRRFCMMIPVSMAVFLVTMGI